MRLAFYINARFCLARQLRRRDYESVALGGLWHASLNFMADKGAKFSSYAWPCIEGALKTARRHETSHVAKERNGFCAHFLELFPAREDGNASQRERFSDAVEDAIRVLRPREIVAIRERCKGQTLEQCGLKMRVSTERFRQIYTRAIRRIQDSTRSMQLLSRVNSQYYEPRQPTATRNQPDDTQPWMEIAIRAWEDAGS